MTAAADLEFVQYKTLRSRIDFQNAAISNARSLLIEFKLYLCRIKQSNGELEKCCCVFPMPITIRSNPFQSIKLRSKTNKTKQCKHCHCKEAICFRTVFMVRLTFSLMRLLAGQWLELTMAPGNPHTIMWNLWILPVPRWVKLYETEFFLWLHVIGGLEVGGRTEECIESAHCK